MLIEQDHFQFITEGIRPVADGADRVYYTEARDHYDERAFRNFSIKIPQHGTVLFETGSNNFELEPGYYLLARAQQGKMVIESAQPARCICIDISKATIRQAITTLEASGNLPVDLFSADYFFSPDFFESTYPLRGNDLGTALNNLGGNLLHNKVSISITTFQNLARELVLHEYHNLLCLGRLKARRAGTRKGLLSRLWKARSFMDEHYLRNPPIPEVAAHCNMSGFYFFRSFKQAFEVTPYEYITAKRLAHAQKLLFNDISLTAIAVTCGFPDVFTFSKAFKKCNGLSPSKFRLAYNSKAV
jgi:AraC-like DNA-binding protein